MEVIKNLVAESKYYIKCPYSMVATRIVVHNSGNDASAKNEVAYMIKNDNQVSFHYAIDDKEIVQGIPENRNTYNAGDGNGKGNREGVSMEICYSLSGGDRFIKAEQNAAKFIAEKLKEKGWGIDRVTKHQDYNGKYCPHRTLDLGWQRFLNMIQSELNALDSVVSYCAHIQNLGWSAWINGGETAGTVGQSLRIEAFKIDPKKLTIKAKVHIQDTGWIDYGVITKDTVIGTTGQSKRLECLCLNGNIKYRIHIQDTGWTQWTNADGIATLGTVGQALRVEAIQIKTL